jgi:hypothetical protein
MILALPRMRARVAAPRTVIAQYSLAPLEVVVVMRNTGRSASYHTKLPPRLAFELGQLHTNHTFHIEGLKSSRARFRCSGGLTASTSAKFVVPCLAGSAETHDKPGPTDTHNHSDAPDLPDIPVSPSLFRACLLIPDCGACSQD